MLQRGACDTKFTGAKMLAEKCNERRKDTTDYEKQVKGCDQLCPEVSSYGELDNVPNDNQCG